jgi:hypothetical protein
MIVGEQQWIGQYHEEEYDLFFKKIRNKIKKKIKKVKPLRIFNPLGTGIRLVNKFKERPRKKSNTSTTKVNVQAEVNKAVEAKEVAITADRQNLVEEMAEFEEKKFQEISKLDEEKVKTEQAKIDVEQGENRKFLYIGLAGLGALVIVGGIIVFIKSKQNKMNALNLQKVQ